MAYGRSFTDIKQRVRDRLDDTAATIFTDAEMSRHLDAAVMDYSAHRPYMKSTTITTVEDRKLYDLPADCLWVTRVWVTDADNETTDTIDDILLDIEEHTREFDDKLWRAQLRERYANTGQPVAFKWNNQLYLYPKSTESGDTINVEYAALHIGTNTDFTTIPLQDIRWVESLMLVRCLEALATDAAKRASYSDGQARVDNSNMAKAFRAEANMEQSKVQNALSESLAMVG